MRCTLYVTITNIIGHVATHFYIYFIISASQNTIPGKSLDPSPRFVTWRETYEHTDRVRVESSVTKTTAHFSFSLRPDLLTLTSSSREQQQAREDLPVAFTVHPNLIKGGGRHICSAERMDTIIVQQASLVRSSA